MSDNRPTKSGKLTLVATPIGNLGDLSERAKATLAAADLIAAEDTRHSGSLLHHFGIKKPLVSYYQHNERTKEQVLLDRLAAGEDIALISDAGTPGISDPGAAILKSAVAAGFEVDAIPGACAAIQALVLSGLPTDKFVFEGFLPRGSKQLPHLQALCGEPRTLVIYEAPHRLRETLANLVTAFGGDRRAAVCRELTKKFQEINRGTLDELAALWQEREIMGEFVLVIEGAPTESAPIDLYAVETHLARLLAGGMKHKAAAKEIARQYGISAGEVYELGLRLKDKAPDTD